MLVLRSQQELRQGSAGPPIGCNQPYHSVHMPQGKVTRTMLSPDVRSNVIRSFFSPGWDGEHG